MNRETAIPRRSLHEQLAQRLRTKIVEGEMAPGKKISEKDLCAAFDVSRTPLREALKVLAGEGLVTLTPNRGAHVAMLTVADLEETFPVIGALEALAGELACQRITDEEIDEISELHLKMRAAYEGASRRRFFILNQQIHEALAEAAGNKTLNAMRGVLEGRVNRARYYASISTPRWDQAMKEHESILMALKERDGPRLGHVLKAHLANKLETLREVIEGEKNA